MAGLTPRMDSFIQLLLDVSGRARPSDLQNVSENEAAELLAAFAAAHPESGAVYDGNTLAITAAPQPAVAPVASIEPPAPEYGTPVARIAEYAAAPVPASIPAVAVDPAAQSDLPAWVFEDGAGQAGADSTWPSTDAVADAAPAWQEQVTPSAPQAEANLSPAHEMFTTESPSEYYAPAPSPESYAMQAQPMADPYFGQAAPEQEYAADGPALIQDQTPDPASQQPPATGEVYDDFAVVDMPAEAPVAWWWYALAVIVPIAGVVGFFVLRREQPKGARTVLLIAVAVVVVPVIIGALAAVLYLR